MSQAFQFKRKLFHLLGLLVPIGLYLDVFSGAFGYLHATRLILFFVLLVQFFLLLGGEFLRFTSKPFSEFYWKLFGSIMKQEESNRLNGTIPYFLANIFVILLLPPELATLSLLILIIGDPSAAFFGSKYGKTRFYNGKSLEGGIGFLVMGMLFGVLFLSVVSFFDPVSPFSIFENHKIEWNMLFVLFLGVALSCVAEFFSGTSFGGIFDDNLLIPVVSGITMAVASYMLLDLSWDTVFFPVVDLFLKS